MLVSLFLISYITNIFGSKQFEIRNTRNISTNNQYPEAEVIFVGSSQIAQNINPNALWWTNKISALNLAINNLDIKYTYYFLKDILRHRSPKVVVIGLFDIYSKEYEEQITNRLARSLSLYSVNRVAAVKDSLNFVKTYDQKVDYLFPLHLYHARNLDKNDFKFDNFRPLNGYNPNFGESWTANEFVEISEDIELDSLSKHYIDKVLRLSKENDVEFLFIKTPFLAAPINKQKEWKAFGKYVEKKGFKFLNFNNKNLREAIGFHKNKDSFDQWHMNHKGANKLSVYISDYLEKNYELGCGNDSSSYNTWNDSYEDYKSDISDLQLLNESGNFDDYINTFKKSKDKILIISSAAKKTERLKIEKIKKNKKWLFQIKLKAKKHNISLDSMLNLEIKWIEKHQNKGISLEQVKKVNKSLSKLGVKEVSGKLNLIVCVSSEGKIYFEEESKLAVQKRFEGWKNPFSAHNIVLLSDSILRGSSIKINGKQYSKNKRGFNVVVYDTKKNKVFDSFNVDMYADSELKINRD